MKKRKSLANILGMASIAVASLFSPKADAQEMINPFVKPQPTLQYYGSGDANHDNLITSADSAAFLSESDQTDIDGDGLTSQFQDALLLYDYLQNGTPYASMWDDSTLTKQQRIDWVKKMVEIDKTDTITNPSWTCGHFADQFYLNFHGDTVIQSSPTYDLINKGRFNLPMGNVYIEREAPLENHIINFVLVGDNPLDWNDLLFIAPQTDDSINIGSPSIPENCKVYLRETKFSSDGSVLDRPVLVEFDISNGTPKVVEYDTVRLVLDRNYQPPVEVDSVAPEVSVSSPDSGSYHNSSVTLEGFLHDNKELDLDSCYYDFNGEKNYFSDSSFSEPLISKEGLNNLEVYAQDKAGNKSSKKINYNYDSQKPQVFAEYNDSLGMFNYEMSDSNLDLDECYYQVNGGEKNYVSSETGSESLGLEPGMNLIDIYAQDKAGNSTKKTLEVNITSTDSEEIEKANFKVYPNPTTEIINLEYNVSKPEKIYTEIYDASGRLMDYYSNEVLPGDSNLEFDLRDYRTGMYLINVTNSEGYTKTEKIIKK